MGGSGSRSRACPNFSAGQTFAHRSIISAKYQFSGLGRSFREAIAAVLETQAGEFPPLLNRHERHRLGRADWKCHWAAAMKRTPRREIDRAWRISLELMPPRRR